MKPLLMLPMLLGLSATVKALEITYDTPPAAPNATIEHWPAQFEGIFLNPHQDNNPQFDLSPCYGNPLEKQDCLSAGYAQMLSSFDHEKYCKNEVGPLVRQFGTTYTWDYCQLNIPLTLPCTQVSDEQGIATFGECAATVTLSYGVIYTVVDTGEQYRSESALVGANFRAYTFAPNRYNPLCPVGDMLDYDTYYTQNFAGFVWDGDWTAAGVCGPSEDIYYEPKEVRAILTELYQATNGASWQAQDNWTDESVPLCQWSGVLCQAEVIDTFIGEQSEVQVKKQLIRTLNLSSNHLSGELPASFYELIDGLLALYPSFSWDLGQQAQLSGPLPEAILGMPNLLTFLRQNVSNTRQYFGQNACYPATPGFALAFEGTPWQSFICPQDTEAAICLEPGTGPSCTAGNPINFRHGVKVQSAVDFTLPNGLSVSRQYTSHTGHWQFNLLPEPLSLSSDNHYVNYHHPSGRVYAFDCRELPCQVFSAANSLNSVPSYRLTQAEGFWQLTTPSGSVKQFDGEGRQVKAISTDGFATQYHYAGDEVTISNAFGQQLVVSLNAQQQPTSILTPIGQLHYQYNADTRLSQVILPDLSTLDYLYDEPQFSQATQKTGLLTGIIDQNGTRQASWHYDSQGRGIQSSHGNGLNTTQIDYIAPELGQTTLSPEVTNPLGGITRYYLNSQTMQAERIDYYDAQKALLAQEVFSYKDDGYLQQKTEKNGSVTLLNITKGRVNNRIEGYGTPSARRIDYKYLGETNLPTRITTPLNTTYLQYNARQQLISETVTDAAQIEQRTTSYQYNEKGLLSAIDGPRTDVNDTTLFDYDEQGRRIKVTNALGQTTEVLSFNVFGLPITIKDINGIVTTFTYDQLGRLISQTRNGLTTTYQYDLAGHLKQTTFADSRTLNYHYDSAYRLIAIEDNLGNRIDYTLDAAGNRIQTSMSDPDGILSFTQRQVFDSLGQLSELINAQGNITEYDYTEDSHPKRITDPLGNSQSYQYNALGQLKATLDAENNATTLVPQPDGRNQSITDAQNKTTQYEYNIFGELTKQISPDSGETKYAYDNAGNLISRYEVGLKRASYYQYDALNRLVYDSSTGAIYSYDDTTNGNVGIGRLTAVTMANATRELYYDLNGNLIKDHQVNNGIPLTTLYQYDSKNRLMHMTYPSTRIVNYEYDNLSQISKVTTTYAGQTQTLAEQITYLPFGPLKTLTYGNGKVLTIDFDLDYLRKNSKTSGVSDISYTLNANQSIEAISDLGDSSQSQLFSYSPTGRLNSAQGDYGNIAYEYDSIGNRLNKTVNQTSFDYQYHADSHQLQTVSSQNTTLYLYNAAGRAIQKGEMSFTYGDNGRITSISNNNLTGHYAYDHRGLRIYKQVDTTRTWFAYDAQGHLLSEQVQPSGTDTQKYADSEYIYLNGELLAIVKTPVVGLTYPEDQKADDSSSDTTLTGTWSQEKSRKAWGGYHLIAAGNTNTAITWQPYLLGGTYNVYANWISNRKNSKQAQYTITHSGQSSTVTLDQSQGGDWQLLGTFDFTGEGNEYVTLNDNNGQVSADAIRFERINDLPTVPQIYYVHNNHLSTPTKLTDTQGNLVWSANYTPFGLGTIDNDADNNNHHITFNIRFPGQYYDAESGLHYNWHRYYDPEIGRYIQSDPIGLAGGISTYGYVGGDPVGYVDPSGLTKITFHRSRGVLIVDPEVEGIPPYVVLATSGVPGSDYDETVVNKGPIPVSNYYIYSKDLSNPGHLEDIARTLRSGDWGDWRVPLKPLQPEKLHGRSGFFLHGGMSAGSAGCVDIGGGLFGNDLTDRVLRDILNDPDGRIQFRVRSH